MTAPSLPAFLLARYDETEAVAKAAIPEERPGSHWQWVDNETDEPSDAEYGVSLRSVEQFPTARVGMLPAFLIHGIDDGHAPALAHIARHDPARVLADVESKRRIVEAFSGNLRERWDDGFEAEKIGREVLMMLALPFADHPDFQEAWKL